MSQQIVKLRAPKEDLIIGNNPNAPFAAFILDYFKDSQQVTIFTVNAVGNKFDELGSEGVSIHRDTIQEWLWERPLRKVVAFVEDHGA